MPSRYEQVKRRYRDAVVATTSDASRFLSARGQKRNRLTLAAIQRAFGLAASVGTPIRSCLDLTCGTGRLFPWLWQRQLWFVGADLSLEMMRAARRKDDAKHGGGVPQQGLSIFPDKWVVLLEKVDGTKGVPQA